MLLKLISPVVCFYFLKKELEENLKFYIAHVCLTYCISIRQRWSAFGSL